MTFEDDLQSSMVDLLTGGDGGSDEAMSNTARGGLLHKRLGDNPSEEECRAAIRSLKEDGLNTQRASMLVQVSLKVLADYDETTWNHLHEAMCDTYPEYAAQAAEEDH